MIFEIFKLDYTGNKNPRRCRNINFKDIKEFICTGHSYKIKYFRGRGLELSFSESFNSMCEEIIRCGYCYTTKGLKVSINSKKDFFYKVWRDDWVIEKSVAREVWEHARKIGRLGYD